MNSPQEKKNQSLSYSRRDGFFAAGMTGFTQDYFVPFALLLGASARQIGILTSIPNFVSAVLQVKTPDLVEKMGSRKKVILTFVFFQAMMLIPMAVMAARGKYPVWVFAILVTLFAASAGLFVPAWGSMMSDLVEPNKRGEFFGRRNKFLGVVLIVMTFVAGAILHAMEKIDIYWGFAILFSCAFVFRCISWIFLSKMYEPVMEHKKENYFTFCMFIRRWKESNFTQFVFFVAGFNLCVQLASPFFAVMMLRELKFGYLLYTIINLTATLLINVLMGRWGRHADIVGNLKIMRTTAPIIAFMPLIWIWNHHPAILFCAQMVSGFAWSGFNLCSSNFIFDAVIPQKRTRCIAYFNFINGMALCLGPLIGGLLIDKLPALFGYQLLTLFLISSILRMFFSFFGHHHLKEVRPVEKVSSVELILSMLGMKSLHGRTI